MPDTSTRLPGHGLRAEGKVGGLYGNEKIGSAVCECGERSPELASDSARRRWHREVHKPEVRARAG